MAELKTKYELGQIAYINRISSINNFIYIEEVRVIGVEFGLNNLINYKLSGGHFRREQDLIADLEAAKDECLRAINEHYDKNKAMLERGENLNKYKG